MSAIQASAIMMAMKMNRKKDHQIGDPIGMFMGMTAFS
jgi:hypothetical protein